MLGVPLLDSSDLSGVPEVSPDDSVTTPAVSSSVDSAPPTEVPQRRYPLRVRKQNSILTDFVLSCYNLFIERKECSRLSCDFCIRPIIMM